MQDFSRRLVIVARKDLLGWQFANAITHVAAYIGKAVGDSLVTGDFFETKDCAQFPRNSQYPFIIKRANSSEQLHNLLEKARAADVTYHVFIREMIDHTSDDDLQAALTNKDEKDVEFLALGVFGENEAVNELTKKFGLWE